MNRLHSWSIKQLMSQGRFEELLEGLMDSVGGEIPSQLQGRMEAHDWQNCLCEFDKYSRVVLGEEGRPKQLYRSRS